MAVDKPPIIRTRNIKTVGIRQPDYLVVHDLEGTVRDMSSYVENVYQATGLGPTFTITRTGKIYQHQSLVAMTQHVKKHNSHCAGVELEGFANTSKLEWNTKYVRQLYALAWLLAWWSEQYDENIPLIAAGEDGKRAFTHSKGVTQHKWVPDNNHYDCGPNFPFDRVMKLARKWKVNGGPAAITRTFLRTGRRA